MTKGLRKDGRYQLFHSPIIFPFVIFHSAIVFFCSSDYPCWYLPSFLSPVVNFHSAIDLFVLLITHAGIKDKQWPNEK
jgi:hypothetical protein